MVVSADLDRVRVACDGSLVADMNGVRKTPNHKRFFGALRRGSGRPEPSLAGNCNDARASQLGWHRQYRSELTRGGAIHLGWVMLNAHLHVKIFLSTTACL